MRTRLRVYLPTVAGSTARLSAYRLYTTLSGLEELEQATPRIHLTICFSERWLSS